MANSAGYIDASISSLSGSSQQLLAENNTRGSVLIQNIGNANIGIAFAALTTNPNTAATATAAIASAGTYTIAPGNSFSAGGLSSKCPTNAIFVIGTAGQPVSCSWSN